MRQRGPYEPPCLVGGKRTPSDLAPAARPANGDPHSVSTSCVHVQTPLARNILRNIEGIFVQMKEEDT